MKISIVIPAYNAGKTIRLAVEAALAQDCPGCEIVVVDDGSTDNTPEVVKRYPAVKYIKQENAGPAAARNTGWRNSQGEAVLFTDSDCIPGTDWAKGLVGAFTDESIGATTGSYDIANLDETLPRLIHEEIRYRHKDYGGTVRFFGSYNAALKRSVLEKTGGFDESYRRASGEDNDLSYRVLKLGYKIAYAPGALVAHHHTSRLYKYLKEQYTHGYWRMKLYRAHPDMAGGDDYTRMKDVVEPPLALLNMAFVLVLPFMPGLFTASALALFAIQIPAALGVAVRLKDAGYLLLAPVTFLRAYARGLGMLMGFVRFFLSKR